MIPQCCPQTPSTRFTSTILSPVLPTRASLAETTDYSQIQSLKMITVEGHDLSCAQTTEKIKPVLFPRPAANAKPPDKTHTYAACYPV